MKEKFERFSARSQHDSLEQREPFSVGEPPSLNPLPLEFARIDRHNGDKMKDKISTEDQRNLLVRRRWNRCSPRCLARSPRPSQASSPSPLNSALCTCGGGYTFAFVQPYAFVVTCCTNLHNPQPKYSIDEIYRRASASRFMPADKQPPLLATLSHSAAYRRRGGGPLTR